MAHPDRRRGADVPQSLQQLWAKASDAGRHAVAKSVSSGSTSYGRTTSRSADRPSEGPRMGAAFGKVGPLWVRLLAYPGDAQISSLEAVPVAVDVQVRKVTEYLGVTDTAGRSLDDVRAHFQAAWAADVAAHGAAGPDGLANTPGALDPALWFYGKWGCSFCERARRSP